LRGLLRLLARALTVNLLPGGRKLKGYGAGAALLHRKPFLEDWAILFRLLEEGKIRPVIGGCFPLLEAVQANALLEGRQVVGNLVLVAPDLIR
jgi:NADPH:quinone reductase-like Zn-dependent oxidoreductase